MGPQCVILAGMILSSLDATQGPCQNFYEFVSKYKISVLVDMFGLS